jgi:hypothetical protein
VNLGRYALPLVAARHFVWARRDRVRELLWRDRLGYELRVPPANRIEIVETALPETRPPAAAGSGCLGALDGGTALAECARYCGLEVEEARPGEGTPLVERALEAGWPLLGSTPAALTALDYRGWQALSAFLARGGTLHLAGAGPGTNALLEELGARLELEPIEAQSVRLPSGAILFPGESAAFAQELAGVRVQTAVQGFRLHARGRLRALCLSVSGDREEPSVVEQAAGRGRIVVSSFPARLPVPLARSFGPEQAPLFLPPLMLLRETFGEAVWRPPAQLANFTIDDPALREGLLGLPYSRAARLAREHGFHVSVATIPAELGLAQRQVIAQLVESPDVISACYHGCDHDGYEFYRSEGEQLRYRPRPLEEQRAALARAVEYGLEFTRRTGYELDRVMVFPHGLGPAAILPDLHRLGFVASCNLDNRYPLEAPLPEDSYLGVRPADTAWGGFPLLWRRKISDPGYLLDLFMGRPALTFEHRQPLGDGFEPFVRRAEELRAATGNRAAWCSLDEVARHAYLQRRHPERGWEALITSNEVCLHNPDDTCRTYSAWRPDLPADDTLQVDGGPASAAQPAAVQVPAHGTAVVRVLPGGRQPRLGRRQRCAIFAPALPAP